MTLATRLKQGLPPLVAGLVLGAAGWMGGANLQPPAMDFAPQLVVRPSGADLVTTRGASPTADPARKGRYSFEAGDFSLEIRQKDWPPSKVEIEEPRGMTTVRAAIPRATLSIAIKGDNDAEARLTSLPGKEKLKTAQGQARLEPGAHELLVEADGYIPKRLSVELKPAERKIVVVALDKLPTFPSFPSGLEMPPNLPSGVSPSVPSGTPQNLPSYRPPGLPSAPAYRPPAPTYRPPAPRPTYRPPAPRPSAAPAPNPVPRFTPIAPPAQPPASDPVPMFTPIRH